MRADFSLGHLTVLDLPPPAMLSVAARAGYRYVGLRPLPATPGGVAYPLMDDKAMMRETKARMAATGVGVLDIEIIRLEPRTDVRTFLRFLKAGAELGAKHVLTAGNDPDESRLIERFAALCDLAAPLGLNISLEFMPWTDAPNLASAARIVGGANRPNGNILVDTLHFARSDSTLDELDRLPRSWLQYVQLCDAPGETTTTTEGLLLTARAERLFPGEGGIDIAGILRHMPRNIPISLEVPTETLARTVGHEERARRAREAAERVLATV